MNDAIEYQTSSWGSPLLLAAAVLGVHVWLFSDRIWLESILAENARAAIRAGRDGGSEETRQAMLAAMDTGALGILLGARAIWTLTRSHLIFWGIAIPVVLLTAGRWDRLREMAVALAGAMWVLAAGVVLNGVLRWVSIRMQATWSPAFFLEWFDGRLLLHDLASKCDLFLLLYFLAVSRRWSAALGKSTLTLGAILLLVWLLLTLLAFLLSSSLVLTF